MKKIIPILIAISIVLYPDSCSISQEKEALKIFKESRFEKNLDKKVDLLFKAQKECSLIQIEIEIEKILVSEHIDELTNDNFGDIERKLNNLSNKNDRLDNKFHIFKFNSKIEINQLFKELYQKQKERGIIRNLNIKLKNLDGNFSYNKCNDKKSLEDIGGMYKSDLRFNKNQYTIRNTQEANELVRVIEDIISNQPNAIFTVSGFASSEGNQDSNYILSKNRADSFIKLIKSKNNIKKFAKGESILVCKDGLLAEKDMYDEYRCPSGEDKDASRRVVIRRVN